MATRVKEILSWYGADNPGVLTNLSRLMNTGRLAGTGKIVILPVDQGFEHGPDRSFAVNPSGYDPRYHLQLAVESGCNAFAGPLGFLELGAREFAGEIPLILKLNNSDSLYSSKDPKSVVTGTVEDALRLGCVGIGFTIYPGSSQRNAMYEEIQKISEEAKKNGLVVVVWSYPRGSQMSKDGETAIDIISYGAHIAAELGAHIIKVKAPTSFIEQDESKKIFEKFKIPVATMAERTKHVVLSCFNGRRIVIFSGGATKSDSELIEEVKGLAAGGGFGSIMGRNAFQRPKAEAIKLLHTVQDIFKEAPNYK
jgi:class I fructose-bisphosphate aldolase